MTKAQHELGTTGERDRLFVSIPEAGMMAAGLGRSASYAAAKRGQLPTLRVGRRIIVPLGLLRAQFGLDPEPRND